MLSAMRSGKYKYFFYGLLGLLALGLIGIGSGGVGHGSVRSIGKVGEQSIPVTTYVQTMRSSLQSAAQQVGRALSPAEIQAFGIERNVLNAVIRTAAMDNEAKRLGLSVGDEAVAEAIRSTPAYQGISGTFDKEAYEFALERSQVSATENENSIREVATRRLLERAVGTGYSDAQTHASIFVNFSNEQRDFDWINLTVDDLKDPIPTPTADELQKHYTDNPLEFTTAETKQLTYAIITPDMVIKDIEIDDALLRQDYEAQKTRFSLPERRILDRIVFGDIDQANAAKARLDSNEVTYDALATERGLEATDIDLGEVEVTGLSADAGKLLFAQEEPGIFGPVQSDLGPALFRINAILDAQNTSFEEAREELFNEAVGDEANNLIADLVETLDDKLAAGDTLEQLTQETELVLEKYAFTADSEDGIARYVEFRNAANAAQVGDFEEVNDLSDGGVFILRVDEITPSSLQAFDDVKDDVTTSWTAAKRVEMLDIMAKDLVEKMNAGQSFDDLGLEATKTTGAVRNVDTNGLPNSAKLDFFELDEGKALDKEFNGVVYVAKMNKITKADLDADENKVLLDSLKQQLAVQTSADVITLFSDALQTQAGVTLNQAAINSLNSQITSY